MSENKPSETQAPSDELQVEHLDEVAGGVDGSLEEFDNTGCANVLAKCG